jgi:glycosyltransferase involved in cell wall biosynthesis
MNILLINHYAGSLRHGMEYRPFYLAREWLRIGHTTTVVAASHSHLRQENPTVSGRIASEQIEQIPYLWIATPVYLGNGAKRAVNIFTFVAQLMRFASKLAKQTRPDVVIASSTYPLDMLPARRIARKTGALLVYEVHDLWPLSPIELGGMSPGHPFIRIMQWAENYACHHSDRVISLLPRADLHLIEHGMAPEKYAVVPNGIDLEGWDAVSAPMPETHAHALCHLREENRFLIGYAGGHAVSNALDSFILAADRLRDLPISLVLVGNGAEKERLCEMAKERGLTNVLFLPAVPKVAVPGLLAQMDALFLGWQNKPIYRFGISPNKLMDYMMAAKPIIHANSAGNDLVAESGCGISTPPEDADAIAEAIRKLYPLSPPERETIGARGRAFVMERYTYPTLARQFLDALKMPEKRAGTCE